MKVKGTGLIGKKVRLGASVRQAWRRGNKVVAAESGCSTTQLLKVRPGIGGFRFIVGSVIPS